MDKWVGLAVGIIGLLNILLLIGRWTQKVESPVTITLLGQDIKGLIKEIGALRDVFDHRYTGLEGRYVVDHDRLRLLLIDKAVIDQKLAELRNDLDQVRVRCGILNRREGDGDKHD